MAIHDKLSHMCLEKIICAQAKKKRGVETLICKCKWEKRKLQFACEKRKLQFAHKKTGVENLICKHGVHACAQTKKDKHEKENRQVGLSLSAKGGQQWRKKNL